MRGERFTLGGEREGLDLGNNDSEEKNTNTRSSSKSMLVPLPAKKEHRTEEEQEEEAGSSADDGADDFLLGGDGEYSDGMEGAMVGGGLGGEEKDWLQEMLPPRLQKAFGILVVSFSAFVFSIMSLLVKLTGKTVGSFELVAIRSAVQLSLVLVYLTYYRITPYQSTWKLKTLITFIFRGVFGISGVSAVYFATQFLPLGDTQALFFSSAVFVGIVAYVVLGEPYTGIDFAVAMVAMVGVVCVAQPPAIFGKTSGADADPSVTSTQRWVAVGLALMGACCSAGSYICIRSIGKAYSYQIHTFYFALVGIIAAPILAVSVQELRFPATAWEWSGSIGVGICGFLGQTAINKGAQLVPAGTVGVIRLLDVLFSFVWQMLFTSDTPLLWSVVGATIIAASIGFTTWRKALRARQDESTIASAPQEYIRLVDFLATDSYDDSEGAASSSASASASASDSSLSSAV